jgi:hypothetical protein
VTGGVVLNSTSALKGAYAATIPNVSGAYLTENFSGVDDLHVSFYLKVNSLPAGALTLALVTNAGTNVGNIRLLTTGALRLRQDTTAIGVDSAPLAVGTVYRVGLHQRRGTGADAILEAYLAVGDAPFGAPFAAMTTGTWMTQADRQRLGPASATVAVTFDDIRLDSAVMPGP